MQYFPQILEPLARGDGASPSRRVPLAVLPQSPGTQQFPAQHPQFLPLIPARQRRRFRPLMASRDAGQDRR